jgi:uncharacterized protein (UPF0210 family)
MTKQGLKVEIEKLAKEEGISFLSACSAMQSAATKLGSENMIELIAELKKESDEYKALFS